MFLCLKGSQKVSKVWALLTIFKPPGTLDPQEKSRGLTYISKPRWQNYAEKPQHPGHLYNLLLCEKSELLLNLLPTSPYEMLYGRPFLTPKGRVFFWFSLAFPPLLNHRGTLPGSVYLEFMLSLLRLCRIKTSLESIPRLEQDL